MSTNLIAKFPPFVAWPNEHARHTSWYDLRSITPHFILCPSHPVWFESTMPSFFRKQIQFSLLSITDQEPIPATRCRVIGATVECAKPLLLCGEGDGTFAHAATMTSTAALKVHRHSLRISGRSLSPHSTAVLQACRALCCCFVVSRATAEDVRSSQNDWFRGKILKLSASKTHIKGVCHSHFVTYRLKIDVLLMWWIVK